MANHLTRAAGLATIAEHNTTFLGRPDASLFRCVFDKLGWSAFTDEAISEFAEWHVWRAEDQARRNAENCSLHPASPSQSCDQSEAA